MDLTKRAAATTEKERTVMEITERVASMFSILGIFFIFGTYLFNDKFRRPINRLVFFASFGNLGMNVAALIAEEGPRAGPGSGLCQFQGFLVQMFLGVDAYWSFCMAVNVYLIFFAQFSTKQLGRLDVRYIFACYGLAFVPALVFTIIDTDQGKIYGDAVLWCWAQPKWAVLRIGLVYSVSWLAIGLAVVVYVLAAVDIYRRRDQLQPGFMNPLNDEPLKSVVITEISVTVEPCETIPPILPEQDPLEKIRAADLSGKAYEVPRLSPRQQHFTFERAISFPGSPKDDEAAAADHYRVAIQSPEAVRPPPHAPTTTAGVRALTRTAAEHRTNTDAVLYARAAFFYFVALLVIWLPSSANRAYAVAHPTVLNFPLNYASCLLLSAQGLFNCIVYMCTSRDAMSDLFYGWVPRRPTSRGGRGSSRRRSKEGSETTTTTAVDSDDHHRVKGSSSRPNSQQHDDWV